MPQRAREFAISRSQITALADLRRSYVESLTFIREKNSRTVWERWMRTVGKARGFAWLVLPGLLCFSSVVPSRIFADDKVTSASPATIGTPKASEPEQAPTGGEAQTNNSEPQRRALPAPLDGAFPGTDYLGPTPLIGVPDTDPAYQPTKAAS